MANLNRRPLSNCSLQTGSVLSPSIQITATAFKRPISPEPPASLATYNPAYKRVKLADPFSAPKPREKVRKHIEREQQKAEFREKYTRAFPGFTFYFDELSTESTALENYEEMIEQLGAKTVRFLDKAVTHFISNRTEITPMASAIDKENNPKLGLSLRSPIKLKGRTGEDIESGVGVSSLSYKIWNTTKLESVLTRCLEPPVVVTSSAGRKHLPSLARLLKSEQIHGTTERDPTQKRHDFKYFARGTKFILIEDIRQELATIAAYEYPTSKPREGAIINPPWPVLHCHPQARGPFIAFDEKERRRWEKTHKAEEIHKSGLKEHTFNIRRFEASKRKTETSLCTKNGGDLRRSVSMNNLRRKATLSAPQDSGHLLEGEGVDIDSAVASGFLMTGTAGYMAASGNSVGITSTAGTTSTTGYTSRPLQFSASFGGRVKHIVTSRKPIPATADKENKPPLMGPPVEIPEKQPLLKKSRSTNTLKLPKREEGSKPGYCESCRAKFDNFQMHISGRKHQRFATDDANFLQLDCVLARVKRRTKEHVSVAFSKRKDKRICLCNSSVRLEDGLQYYSSIE